MFSNRITYCVFAQIIAISFVIFWSLSSFIIDFSTLRWVNIAFIFIFIFLLITQTGQFPYLFWIIGIFLPLLFSVLFSSDVTYSFAQYIRFASIVLFALFLTSLQIENRMKVFWSAIYTIVVLTVLSVLLYPILHDQSSYMISDRPRYSGFFYHANITGFSSGIALLYSIYWFLFAKTSKWSIVFYILILIASLFLMIYSDSRSAILASVVGIMVLLLCRYNMQHSLKGLAYSLIAFAFIPLFLVITMGYISLDDNSNNQSIVERFYLWNVALSEFKSSQFVGGGFGLPFLTGYEAWDGHEIFYPYAHNIVINSIAWSGYMGGFFIGAIFFILIKLSKLRYLGTENLYFLPLSLVFYVFSWSILDGALQGMWLTHFVFWLSVAMLIRLRFNSNIAK